MTQRPADSTDTQRPRRYVLRVTRPRCEVCGAVGLKVYGGFTRSTGQRIQYARCRICKARHIIIAE
jgi:hypothetical protein